MELRFADLQRTKLSSLSYDNMTLRGLSFRTNTSNLGAHLGWFAKASYQKAPSHGHTVSLQEFDSLYSQYNISPHKVDFVIPSIDAHSNAEGPRALFPCPTRRHCGIPYTTFSAEAFKPC